MKVDLALLHPPSIYDFRERPILWGPINDLVPSTPVFEMYPMGFVSIASILEKNGYRVAIVNVALRMLEDKNFQPREYLSGVEAELYGIDLHWMPHVHGAVNLARAVREVHPHKPIVMGGLSASYYHREILQQIPEVDFVLRGDSTEEPFLQLMEALGHGDYRGVANLTYRERGRIKESPLSYVPSTLDKYYLDYDYSIKAFRCSRHRLDTLPYKEFMERPIMAVLTRKGCESNCIACGGSEFSYREVCNRTEIAFRSPEKVVEDIKKVGEFRMPAFILGDIALNSEEYGLKILRGIREEGVDVPLVLEFFYPPSKRFMEELGKSVNRYTIEMSPEAGDEKVRRKIGRGYDNQSLRKMVSRAFENNCSQFDLYFMVGLGFQDRGSVAMNTRLAKGLINDHPGKKIFPFVSPYAPFLDPGSRGFEEPERYGYRKYASTLMDHYNLMERGTTWKDFLSYSTSGLDREDIVELSYSQALDFAKMKWEGGLIGDKTYLTIEHRIGVSREMMEKIEKARAQGRDVLSDQSLRVSLEELQERLTISRDELDWSREQRFRRMLSMAKKFLKP